MITAQVEGAVCIPNINTRERRKRLRFGALQAAVAGVVLAVLTARGVDRRWRLVLFPVWYTAASGYFQWRDKT